MAHSYLSVYIHLVFSTKERRATIKNKQLMWAYINGIAENHAMKVLAIGGMEDHIHILISMNAENGIGKLVNVLKSNSSKWIRKEQNDFAWQEGYAAFSVSSSALDSVAAYIHSQAEHHRKRDFKQEYMALLKKHKVTYDPQWVFG